MEGTPSELDDDFDPQIRKLPDELFQNRGPTMIELQVAADLKELSEQYPADSERNGYYRDQSDVISDTRVHGMDGIEREVGESSLLFGTESPNVFCSPGELGAQFGGYTGKAYDNWIGADPDVLDA